VHACQCTMGQCGETNGAAAAHCCIGSDVERSDFVGWRLQRDKWNMQIIAIFNKLRKPSNAIARLRNTLRWTIASLLTSQQPEGCGQQGCNVGCHSSSSAHALQLLPIAVASLDCFFSLQKSGMFSGIMWTHAGVSLSSAAPPSPQQLHPYSNLCLLNYTYGCSACLSPDRRGCESNHHTNHQTLATCPGFARHYNGASLRAWNPSQ
jgi:hypothetical protein